MGIFDRLKRNSEDTTQNDQDQQGNQQGGQFDTDQSGQGMQTAQNTVGQQGGYQDQSQGGNQDPYQQDGYDPNQQDDNDQNQSF
jgi:hypothetical protein